MHWAIEAEYIACIIIIILAFYSKERISHMEQQTNLFYECLFASLFSIVLNIVVIWCMERHLSIPVWLLQLLNSLYFACLAAVILLISGYFFLLIHKDTPDKTCYYRARNISLGLFLLYLAVVVTNFKTGVIFSLGADGAYLKGPGYLLIYLLFVIELGLVTMCYFRQRKQVEASMQRVMKIAPAMVLILATIQAACPDVMMAGVTMAVALLNLFISFQNQKIHTDDMTGLATRELFYYQMERLARQEKRFRAVIVSICQFKNVNEKYGTRVGDAFIKMIAGYIREASGEGIVCRYSGVRFGVIFQDMPEPAFEEYCARVTARFEQPWSFEQYRCHVTVNIADIDPLIGVGDAGELSACLDYAISTVKDVGISCRVHFSQEMYMVFKRQNQLVELIKKGMRDGSFYLDFQPIYNCREEVFDGCEALLRLKDEDGVNVSPAEFIPLAEKRGLIIGLSWMVIEMACRFMRDHPRYTGSVSINFSIQQFLEADMAQRMLELTERFGVAPGRLRIEITERIIAEDTTRVLEVMNQLIRKGFLFYLDDFGTGYSSLAYVLNLPFCSIKLDKTLVDDIGNPRNRILLESIIACFRSIGAEIITEGVETREQCGYLKAAGTDKIQGFYYSRPLPEEAFLELMDSQVRKPR